MNLQKSCCLLALQLLVWQAHTQFASWHCANLGARIGLDEKLIKGAFQLPKLSKEEFICLGEFYGQRDLKDGQYFLYESTAHPQFQFNGYSICQLEKYEITFYKISDLLHEKEEQDNILAFIQEYNKTVMPVYRKRIPAATMEKIIDPPSVIDPYVLKERLALLKQQDKELVRIEEVAQQQIRLAMDLGPLFENLSLPIQQLRFILIDENNNKREELSLGQLRKKGFVLQTDESRLRSSYWYDFRIRVQYNNLTTGGQVVSCEKTEDYYFHFEHFTVTKDYRLISHEH